MQALWANVQSLLTAYDARVKTVRASTLGFRHHPGLHAHREAAIAQIDSLLSSNSFEEVLPLLADLGAHAEESLLYLQRYHWLLLYSVVVLLYVLWMLWVLLELLKDGGPEANGWTSETWRDVVWKAEAVVYCSMAIALAVLASLEVPVRTSSARTRT